MANRCRPAPDDLNQTMQRLGTAKALCRHYRARFAVVIRWIDEAHIDRPKNRGRDIPADFAITAAHSTNQMLARRYRTHKAKVAIWRKQLGAYRKPTVRMVTEQEGAAAYLKAALGLLDYGRDYEEITSYRYAIGKRRLTTREMMDRACSLGWGR